MPRLVPFMLAIALAGVVVWTIGETRSLAELAGRNELQANSLSAQLQARSAQLSAFEAANAAAALDPVAYAALRLELASTQSQLQVVTKLLDQRNAEVAQRVAAAAEERTARVTPEGVRRCLEALHECLRAEGFHGQRFLSAGKLEDRVLADIELIDSAPDGLQVAFVDAERMTATLDRGRGRLQLHFEKGQRRSHGVREPFPAAGWTLTFDDIDGRLFEARLPYLVRGEGAYPVPVVATDRLPTDVDPFTRRQWQRRLDDLLVAAGMDELWHVTHFRGMQDGWFLNIDVVASDARHHVVGGAHCQRAAVEIEAATGVVSLRLVDGVLLRDGAESSIRGEGFRMLLPKLTPETASRAMQGMVVTK